MTPDLTQLVSLHGGSFDGQLWQAEPAPSALRLHVRVEEEEWFELFTFLTDNSVYHPGYGVLPVMSFIWRENKGPASDPLDS